MGFGKKNIVDLNPLHYNICLLGESGTGKEQPVSEPVLTEKGWVRMGDIKPGDKVYGHDGNLYNVTGVFPQGVKDVYKVTFRDGTSTRCGEEHLWTVMSSKQRYNNRRYNRNNVMVKPLSEIMKDYKHTSERFMRDHCGKHVYKYSVPINKPMFFDNKKELLIDPYIMGLLLGDGGFTGNVCTFTNAEDDLLDELKIYFEDLDMVVKYRDMGNHKQGIIKKTPKEYRNKLRTYLDDLGLKGCGSREKFIPKDYLYSSVENRYDLLSGIINTDGCVIKKSLNISTYSKQLCKDIAELARSLGFIAIVHSYDRTDETSTKKYNKEIEYKVNIVGDDYSKLKLSQKHLKKLTSKHISYVKSISNIEYVGKEESQCIMCDNPEHLYVTKDYIVTHNTTICKEMCEKLVGDDGYIQFNIGREDGAACIENIVTEDIEDWAKLKLVVDDIIKNKNTDDDYKNLKTIIWDTFDELILLAEAESIRLSNIHEMQKAQGAKKAETINEAWGGFGRGQEKALELMTEMIWSLKKVGVNPIIIGHVKRADIVDPVSQATYSKLTADTTQKYFNGIKNKMHFIGLAYIDREITKEKTGRKNIATKDEITYDKVVSESRVISFRDDTYAVDSKSRFAEIESRIPFDTDAFIKAMQDAIKAEKTKSGKSDKQIKKEQAEKDKAIKEQADEYVEKSNKEVDASKYIDEIRDKYKSLDADTKAKMKDILQEFGITKVTEAPVEALEKIVELING